MARVRRGGESFGPNELAVMSVDADPPLDVHRIVRSFHADVDDPVFVNSFRSHYELGGEPRGVERSSTAIHMGISVYLSLDAAVQTALKWSKIGEYVAHVELTSGQGSTSRVRDRAYT